ncbi:ankyrin repeat domain-containing protein [Bacteriovorax sp. DB6_IX]|uniref:ankyrin repeat domain-containing protein n=1 Tax=Bacteriovorax sp. DB6_IX TaxID=1353530 RepID=UPI00038A3322|nr:ankyrin repeat domain-containing protein [Bacteriovorax sp. DB6_IX]EQC45977.1 ankyrin repeat protein [Bacteriovorax sp. DB6_IX]
MAIDKQTEEILLDAIENDDFSAIKSLINQDLNIDDKFSDGETILHKCFALRKYTITQHLVLLGADIFSTDKLQRTPLHLGTRSGFIEGTQLYTLLANNLNQQDHKGRIPLMHAIKFKQMLLVKILMAKGSDTDLKDNNGYSSLMWAVKFLDPAELKELMENSDDETIQNQIQECLEQGNELEVCDKTIEQAKEQESDENQSEEVENILPNPIAEMITKPENEEHLAPYSITDHIESLKVKAQEEGFDYEIATLPEDKRVTPEGNIESYQPDEIKKADSDIESFTRSMPSDTTRVEGSSPQAQEAEEIMRVSGSNEPQTEFERQEIQSRPDASNPELLQREEVMRVSGSNPELLDNEIQQIKRPEMEVNAQEMEKIQRATSEGHTALEETELPTRPSSSVQSNQAESQNRPMAKSDSTTVTGQGGTDHMKEEISRVKGLEGEGSSDDLWKTESQAGTENVSDYEITKLKRSEMTEEEISLERKKAEESAESPDTIYTKKKEINYIRDGYKEEYKDDYGEIRTVDKKIGNDELGDIQTSDKQIGEKGLAEIKTVDKTVQSEYEVQEKTPEQAQSTNYSRLEGAPVQNAQEDKIEITRKEITPQQAEQVKRPEMDVKPLEKEEDIMRVKSQATEENSENESDLMKVSSLKTEEEKETIELTGAKDQSAQHTEISGVTEVQNEDAIVVEDEDAVTEDGEPLTIEEQKVVKQMVDPNLKNKKGQTLCWIAAEKGQTALLKKFIQKGADYEIKDTQGVSPLMIASMKGHTEIVEYLAHKVRNVDEKRRDGQTALTLAIESDRPEAVKALLDNGASSETKIKGNTLLMHAANVGSANCIKVLILLGHDPMEKNFRGKTSLDIAKAARQKRAYALLKKIVDSRQAS